MSETLTKGPRMTDKMTRYQVLEAAAAARWEEAR